MSIFDRLSEALELEQRREYTWAKSIGIGRGVISALKETNSPPGWVHLSAIRKAEKISLAWLIEGKGEPFEVTRHVSDDDCAEEIGCMLHDEPWTVVIATDGKRWAFVLHQPGQSTVHGRAGRETPFDYTLCEILLGGSIASLTVIAQTAKAIRYVVITKERMDVIHQAKAGTWRLLLAPDAWLREAIPISQDHPIFLSAEPEPRHLSKEEEIVLQCFMAMEPAQRETYKAIGHTLAKPDDKLNKGNGG